MEKYISIAPPMGNNVPTRNRVKRVVQQHQPQPQPLSHCSATHERGAYRVGSVGMNALQFIRTRDYSALYFWATTAAAFCLTIFYVYDLKSSFNQSNALASIPALIHVAGSVGISLLMFGMPRNSLLRIFALTAMLTLANLG
jgi:hypothetical protein